MEKKVVSKELYDCLNYLIKLKGKEWVMLKHAIKVHVNKNDWISEDFKPLNGLTLDDLGDLLYNGYRLEETKEEKLLSLYKYHRKIAEKNRAIENIYYVSGLKAAIDMLGLEEK